MAGFGTRMRPLTWSRPKQLLQIANQSMLEHVLDMLTTLPDRQSAEFVFITGYLGDQVEAFVRAHRPDLQIHFVPQSEMKGQSDAIYQARHLLDGPMLMVYPDTYLETDLAFLANEPLEAVSWAKAIPDPRNFGVALLNSDGLVKRLIEKPSSIENNLVVMGLYYFADAAALLRAVEKQFEQNIQLNGEYFLVDAINLMLEQGLEMRIEPVEDWLDSGRPENTLAMNRWLLDHGRTSSAERHKHSNRMIEPVFIHPSAKIQNSTVGPHAAIGANCVVSSSTIQDSIIEAGTHISDSGLTATLVGENVRISNYQGELFLGDHSQVGGVKSK